MCVCLCVLTDHWVQDILHTLDELLVNLNGQITKNLTILSQVKVGQTVFILLWSVKLHKLLRKKER